MPSDAYWRRRMEALEDRCHKEARDYTANVEKQFRMAQKNIEDKITYWYSRLADNNELTMQGAKSLLRVDELEEFHWSVEDYVKKGELSNYTAQWKKQLENASAKVHISRLEAMKMQMQQECEVLYGNMADGIDDLLRKMYTENYYQTAYELMKGIGVGWAFNRLDDKRIEKAINTCWTNDGKKFSDRVWTNKQRLVNELNTVLTQNIIRGESPQKAISQLSKRLGVSRSNAGRLIMTESAFIHSQSQKDCFQRLDVERFEFVATLDSRTSEVCQAMDGTVIDMSDYNIGVNVPPLHCFCRSCVVPYYDDNDGMRAARGEDGKVYYVPSNMTYKEWEKSFIDGEQAGLQQVELAQTYMEKKETIYANERKITQLIEQKKDSELKFVTTSDMTVMEEAQKTVTEINDSIKILKKENEILQNSLGLPTNAKERFYGQTIDDKMLPQNIEGKEEFDAISSWTRTDYTFINDYLRNDNKGVRPGAIQNAEILRNMIDRNVVKDSFTVKRGTDFVAMNNLFGSDNWAKQGYNVSGKIITDKGFFATSPDLHGGFGGGIQMYIDVPQGAKGIYIGDLSAAPDEKEFLLQCGTSFEVDRIDIRYDKWNEPQYDVYMRVKVGD